MSAVQPDKKIEKSKVIKRRICHYALLLTVSTQRDARACCLCTVQQLHAVTSTQKNNIWNWMKDGVTHGGPLTPIRTAVAIKLLITIW